jgi:AcrR family transcriptional regulator
MTGNVEARPYQATPLRADARRNRVRVLDAAQAAFAHDGISVPLDEIARRAGVGSGTVYRHFPSKKALFEAVIRSQVERLIADATAAAAAPDPGPAFFGFFREMVQRVSINKALAEALEASTGVRVAAMPAVQRDFRQALATVLANAQRAGQVRDDIDAADAAALALGCITMGRHRDAADRMIALACDALRTGLSRLPSAVTKPAIVAHFGYGVEDDRNETEGLATAHRCAVCGKSITAAATGRPARFCGAACRQKAHRRSRQAVTGADTPAHSHTHAERAGPWRP